MLSKKEKALYELVIVLAGSDFEHRKDCKDISELLLVIEIEIEATLACRTCV